MVSLSPNLCSSATVGKSRERARELYKYFTSQSLRRRSSQGGIKPDTLLISQAQLVTWRLDVRRCLINFIDSNTQYCVADATKTLHLEDVDKVDDSSDCLPSLYTPANAEHSICHNTMSTNVNPLGKDLPPCFEVTDLSKDARFVEVPAKAGSSKMTYYCGTPLRTRNGVVIGAMCIFDDKSRGPITPAELRFLEVISKNVITHLELLRDQAERKRATKLSRCLNMFVDPQSQAQHRRGKLSNCQVARKFTNMTSASSHVTTLTQDASPTMQQAQTNGRPSHGSSPTLSSSPSVSPGMSHVQTRTPTDDYDDGQELRIHEADHINLYKYGAELLQDALDIEEGGGVMFLDASTRLCSPSVDSTDLLSDELQATSVQDDGNAMGHSRRSSADGITTSLETDLAEILASTVTNDATFTAPPTYFLNQMRERYPRGKLWVFDSEGNISDNDGEKDPDAAELPKTCTKQEAQLLQRFFSGARQVIGLPLFDSRTSRWAFCFAWSTSQWRTFSYQTDFLFLIAFCNCMAIEKSRLATMAADQQKGDFIGSISHELRSPLHGILASCEFLQDTKMSTFQTSLVDTVDSCARTLLDTISMVLDYSKINSFGRKRGSWVSSPGALGSDKAVSKDDSVSLDGTGVLQLQPTLNIYDSVDLALITEQVVEGVQSGHVFRDASNLDFARDDSSAHRKSPKVGSEVQLILDIAPGDWLFFTQPGAFRRIVMNIVGNALKYTTKGFIKIKLEKKTSSAATGMTRSVLLNDKSDVEMVRLTVADTGKGISPDYLRTRLFEPFSQEDTLAVGTGLGLSLVKSIVTMLKGNIDVRSTVNSGTNVTVNLPLERATQVQTAPSSPNAARPGSPLLYSEDLAALTGEQPLRRIGIFNQCEVSTGLGSISSLLESVRTYMTQWFRIDTVHDVEDQLTTDIIVADESDTEVLLGLLLDQAAHPSIIVLCSNISRRAHLSRYAKAGMEFISKPVGPHKLAKALRTCLGHRGEKAAAEQSHELPHTLAGQSVASSNRGVQSMSLEDLASPTTPPAEIPSEPIQAVRPTLTSRRTISASKQELKSMAEDTAATTTTLSQAGDCVDPRPVGVEPEHTQVAAADMRARQPRCLLVDDNHINLKLLEVYTKKRKYKHVLTATNGVEAVEAFESGLSRNSPPDLIFMDLSMPIMGGLEATRKIREIEGTFDAEQMHSCESDGYKTTPRTARRSLVVALTGLASGKDQADAFSSGVDIYMTKPLSFKELGKLLDNWEKRHC